MRHTANCSEACKIKKKDLSSDPEKKPFVENDAPVTGVPEADAPEPAKIKPVNPLVEKMLQW